jgi:hypothetical protein
MSGRRGSLPRSTAVFGLSPHNPVRALRSRGIRRGGPRNEREVEQQKGVQQQAEGPASAENGRQEGDRTPPPGVRTMGHREGKDGSGTTPKGTGKQAVDHLSPRPQSLHLARHPRPPNRLHGSDGRYVKIEWRRPDCLLRRDADLRAP